MHPLWTLIASLLVFVACSHNKRSQTSASRTAVEEAPIQLTEEVVPWNRFPLDRLADDDMKIWNPRRIDMPSPEVVQNVNGRYYGIRWIQGVAKLNRYVSPGDIYVAYSETAQVSAQGSTDLDMPIREVGIVVSNRNGQGQRLFPDFPADSLCRITFPRSASGCDWPQSAHFLRFLVPYSQQEWQQLGQQFANVAKRLYQSASETNALSVGERLQLLGSLKGKKAPRSKVGAQVANEILFAAEVPALVLAANLGFWPVRSYGLSQLASVMRKSAIAFGKRPPSQEEMGLLILQRMREQLMAHSSSPHDVEKVSSYLEKLAHIELYEAPEALVNGKYDAILGSSIHPVNYLRDALEPGEAPFGRLHYTGTLILPATSQETWSRVASRSNKGYVDFLLPSAEQQAVITSQPAVRKTEYERFSNRASDR